MKLIVASILAMSAACVTEPQPAPPSEDSVVSEVSWNAVRECFNRDTGDCVTIPATFANAYQDCVSLCRQIGGDPTNQCRITYIGVAECW